MTTNESPFAAFDLNTVPLCGCHNAWLPDRLAMFLMRYRDALDYDRHIDRIEFGGHDELLAMRLARSTKSDGESSDSPLT
jgi:hypothetical protein